MTSETSTLGDLFTIARGGSPRPIDAYLTDAADGINWIMIGDASEGTKHISSTKKRIRPEGASRSRHVKPGDLLLTNSMSFGRPYILATHGCIHDGWLVLSPRAKGVDPNFFYFLLGSTALYSEFARLAAGAVVKNLNIDLVRSVRVAVPLLAEQRRIADILDKADSIRRKRAEAVAMVDELLRATFLDMFGDPVTNPKGWPVQMLREIAAITTGNTPPRAVPENFGDAVEWIKSDNINTPSHFLTPATEGLSERGRAVARTVAPGSTLVTCIAGSRDCIGNAALADRTVAFNQQINAVTPGPVTDHRYLYALILVGKRLVQLASTNSMKGMVSKGKLEQVLVPFPGRALQADFGRAFDKIIALSETLGESAAESNRLFDSLVQRAFSGQLTSSRPSARPPVQTSLFAEGP